FVHDPVPTGADVVVLQVIDSQALPAFAVCGAQLATSVGPVAITWHVMPPPATHVPLGTGAQFSPLVSQLNVCDVDCVVCAVRIVSCEVLVTICDVDCVVCDVLCRFCDVLCRFCVVVCRVWLVPCRYWIVDWVFCEVL